MRPNNIFFSLVLFFLMFTANAQEQGQIQYDANGALILPSSMSESELEFLASPSRYVARGEPFDSTSMFIKGKPDKRRAYEVARVSSRHEYTNLMDKAWTVMLFKQGIIPLPTAKKVLTGLLKYRDTYVDPDKFMKDFDPQQSSASSELLLLELVGGDVDIASIPQLGRTQQEPMARMQLRDKQLDVIDKTHELLDVLIRKITEHSTTIMPGMTHMAHAQPTTYGAYLLALYDGIARTLEHLELSYKHTNMNSGGVGATSGAGWGVDRQLITELLGFDQLLEPAYDGEAGQDFAFSTLSALSNMMLILSRTAIDHSIWGMDGYYTHILATHHRDVSSFMPQKLHNGSPWEFVRLSANNVLGAMMQGALGLHNEPFGDVLPPYQAPYLTRSAGAIGALCEAEMINWVVADMLETMTVDKEKLLQLTKDGWGRTPDLAAYLTKEKGYSMRKAHHISAVFVRIAREHRKINPAQLTGAMLDEAARVSHEVEPNISTDQLQELMNPEAFIARHRNVGDPNPKETIRLLESRKKELEVSKGHQKNRRARIAIGYEKLEREVQSILAI